MYKRIEGIIQLKTKKLPPAIDEKEAYGKDQVGSDSLGSWLGKGKDVKGLGCALPCNEQTTTLWFLVWCFGSPIMVEFKEA